MFIDFFDRDVCKCRSHYASFPDAPDFKGSVFRKRGRLARLFSSSYLRKQVSILWIPAYAGTMTGWDRQVHQSPWKTHAETAHATTGPDRENRMTDFQTATLAVQEAMLAVQQTALSVQESALALQESELEIDRSTLEVSRAAIRVGIGQIVAGVLQTLVIAGGLLSYGRRVGRRSRRGATRKPWPPCRHDTRK